MPTPFDVNVPNVAQALLGFQRARRLADDRRNTAANREIALERLGLLKSGQQLTRETAEGNRAFRTSEAERAQANTDRAFGLQQKQFDFARKAKNTELELKRMKADFTSQGGFKDKKQRADVESGLRKEFTAITKDFRKVRDAAARVEASAKDPSAAGDLALIFNYMKILDPGSVVRESEFATAQNAAGVPDRVRSVYNRVLSGKRLAKGQRDDFVSRAKSLFGRQNNQFKQTSAEFRGIGTRLGVDVENVIPDFSSAPVPNGGDQPAAPPPPPGFQVIE